MHANCAWLLIKYDSSCSVSLVSECSSLDYTQERLLDRSSHSSFANPVVAAFAFQAETSTFPALSLRRSARLRLALDIKSPFWVIEVIALSSYSSTALSID